MEEIDILVFFVKERVSGDTPKFVGTWAVDALCEKL